MERTTITLDADLLAWIDALCAERGYASRSEAFRDLVRAERARASHGAGEGTEPCFGALSYVYDHETRDLANRLTTSHHHHHGLSVATTHVHVDPHNCLEISILSGPAAELRAFADSVTSQRGVRHGSLNLIPLDIPAEHGHVHAPPRNRRR